MEHERHLLLERRALMRTLGAGGGLYGIMGGSVAGTPTSPSGSGPMAVSDPDYETASPSEITTALVSAAKSQFWDPFWDSLRGSWSDAISELRSLLDYISDRAFDIVTSPFDDDDDTDTFDDTLDFSMSGIETLLDKADFLMSHGKDLADALGDKASSLEEAAKDDDDEESNSQSIQKPPNAVVTASAGAGSSGGTTVGTSVDFGGIGDGIKEKYDDVRDSAEKAGENAVDAVTNVIGDLGLDDQVEGLWGDVTDFVDEVASISDYVTYAADAISEVLLEPLRRVEGYLDDLFSEPSTIPDFEADMSVFTDSINLDPQVTTSVDTIDPTSRPMTGATVGAGSPTPPSSAGGSSLGYSAVAANDNSHIKETLEKENIILDDTLEDFLQASEDSSVYEVLRENEALDEFFEDIEDEYIEYDHRYRGRQGRNDRSREELAFQRWIDDNNIENKADLRNALAEYNVVFEDDLEAFFDGAGIDVRLQFKDCEKAPSNEVYAMQSEMKLSDNATAEVFVGHDPFDPACFYVATDGSLKIEVDGQQIGAWVLEYQQHWKDIGNWLETSVDDIDSFDGEEITGVETVADLEDLSDSLETFETDLEQWLDRREISTETAYDLINEFFEDVDIENDLGDLADELETQHDNLTDQIESVTGEIEADIGAIEDEFASHLRDFSSALELDELRNDLGETEIKVEDGELLPPDEAIGVVADWAGELGEQQTEDLNFELPRQTQQTSTELINWIDGLGKSDKEMVKSQTGVDLDNVKTYLEYFDEGTFNAGQMANEIISNRVEKILNDIKSRAEEMMTWSRDFGNEVLNSGCTRKCPEKPTPKPTLHTVLDELAERVKDSFAELTPGEVIITIVFLAALAVLAAISVAEGAVLVPVIIFGIGVLVIGNFLIDHLPMVNTNNIV